MEAQELPWAQVAYKFRPLLLLPLPPPHARTQYLTDIDECQTPGVCPTGLCTNTEGSFSCVACDPGFTVAPDGVSCEGTVIPLTRAALLP